MNAIFWNSGPDNNPYGPTIMYRYIGPYKVANWVREHGYTAQVIDFVLFFTEEELWNITKKFITKDTVVLGISTTFLSHHFRKTHLGKQRMPDHVLKVMARIKSEYPAIKIILGGTFAESIGTWKIIDGGVVGKAEDIFLELLDHYINGSPPPKNIKKFPHWGKEVTTHYYEATHKKYDIEKDRFKFHLSDCIVPGETLPLELSRGCIFKCKFCQYDNLGRAKLDYLRATKCIEEEILYNYENFNVTNYHILCDTFNDTVYKINEWCNMVKGLPFKINFTSYMRADLLHRFPDTCYQLKEAGLMGVFFGLETLTPEPAKLIGKSWSGKHAREWLPSVYHEIWNREVAMSLGMIVGLPGDLKENVEDTFDWFVKNDLHDISYSGLAVFKNSWKDSKGSRSSEFDRESEKYGFKFGAGVNEWYNGDWNWETAANYAKELNIRSKEYRKYNNWSSLGLLAYGFDKNYILNTKEKDWNQEKTYQGMFQFIKIYKEMINAL